MQGIAHTIRRLIETSLSDQITYTRRGCVANVFYKFKLIIIKHVFSTQCMVLNIQSDS